MIIDFDKMDEKVIPEFRGGEKEARTRMHTDDENKIAKFVLVPGASIGMHTHESNSETVYILSGRGRALYDDGCEEVTAGTCHYCPKGHAHSLINDGEEDLVFFAVIGEHN